MKNQSKKVIVLEVVMLLSLVIIWGFAHFGATKEERKSNENAQLLTITFLDVSKGDCIVIETTKGNVMIDTGYDENGEDIVAWLKEQGIETLSYLVLTHPDKDHIGGADTILKKIRVEHVIQTDCEVDSDDYSEYQEVVAQKAIDLETLTDKKDIILGEAKFSIYPPIGTTYKGENNYSLVTKLVYKETDFLFAGDAEEERISELLTQIPDIKSMLLKVPHHGSLMENSEEFFEAVSPKYAIITNNREKMYESVTKLLQKRDAEVFVTNDGNITVQSNGKEIDIHQ